MVSLCLLGLGLVAVVADRLFFLPAGADAATPTEEMSTPAPRAEAAAPGVIGPDQRGVPLNERLQAAAGGLGDAARDAFSLPGSWMAPADMGPPAPEAANASSENFVRSHKLTAILTLGKTRAVIIDGKRYHVGERLDGLELTEIESGGAVFASPSGPVRLALFKPAEGLTVRTSPEPRGAGRTESSNPD